MVDSGTPALPRHSAVLGFTLFASIAAPFADGVSVLDWLWELGARDPFAAVLGLFTFGAPFLFGLAVALAGLVRDPRRAAAVIQIPLALTHAVLVLHALVVVQIPRLPLRFSFVGFVAVASIYYLYARADADAADRPLGPGWLARWGGIVLTGVTFWLHFQTFGPRPFGPAIHLALAAAFLLAATTPRDPGQPRP